VPLSDVVVWKTNINRVKPEVTRAMENWNHCADIDLLRADGETLMVKYLADESTLNYRVWMSFYKDAPVRSELPRGDHRSHRGRRCHAWRDLAGRLEAFLALLRETAGRI
jgi:hypothetical protein